MIFAAALFSLFNMPIKNSKSHDNVQKQIALLTLGFNKDKMKPVSLIRRAGYRDADN